MMKFRSKAFGGLALAVASITALAACSSSGCSSGAAARPPRTSRTPAGPGTIPVAASGAKVKAGTITWALPARYHPELDFPRDPVR